MPSPCLAEAVAVHGHLRPHVTALVSADRTVSYGELGELTQSFRHHLLELNLPAGSTICVPAHKVAGDHRAAARRVPRGPRRTGSRT